MSETEHLSTKQHSARCPNSEQVYAGLRFSRAKIFSSKFHLFPLGLCLLFLIIAANNLTASAFKEFEISCINGSLSTSQRSFNFLDLYKVSHPRCVGEHNISKTAVEIVFNTTVLLELKYLTHYKVRRENILTICQIHEIS